MENKFETRAPAAQNAVDIFRGKWASKIGELVPGIVSGDGLYFNEDPRPRLAAKWLGNSPGSFAGMNILELGPLEAGHTFQLVSLGADKVTSVESNTEAYMKCLIVKEILQIQNCSFMLGDCVSFLESYETKYDIIFCSGILYHMSDPYRLIKAIANRTNKVYVWTTYFNSASEFSSAYSQKEVIRDGKNYIYHELRYGDRNDGLFWGG